MTGVEVVPLRPALQEQARQLILDGLEEHWGVLDPSLNSDLIDIAANHDLFVVALDGSGRVIGTAGLRDHRDGRGEVLRMSVANHWRRRGVGRLLLDALAASAEPRGVARLVLQTTASWADARGFYEGCGFTFLYEWPGPFGADAYYERTL